MAVTFVAQSNFDDRNEIRRSKSCSGYEDSPVTEVFQMGRDISRSKVRIDYRDVQIVHVMKSADTKVTCHLEDQNRKHCSTSPCFVFMCAHHHSHSVTV